MIHHVQQNKASIIVAISIALVLIIAAVGFVKRDDTVSAQSDLLGNLDLQEIQECMASVRESAGGTSAKGGEVQGPLFSEKLSVGDQSVEVARLHDVLNCDPRTEVEGPIETVTGGKGTQEVEEVFTEATAEAVRRFQELYGFDDITGTVEGIAGTSIGGDTMIELLNGLTSESLRTRYESLISSLAIGGFGFGSTLPFGGMVSLVEYCTCGPPGSIAVVTVGPPRGGRFLYHSGTPVYQYFQIPREGVWLLGNYFPGWGPCFEWVGKSCVPVENQGVITIVGTSR
jgi:hypothetical protein